MLRQSRINSGRDDTDRQFELKVGPTYHSYMAGIISP